MYLRHSFQPCTQLENLTEDSENNETEEHFSKLITDLAQSKFRSKFQSLLHSKIAKISEILLLETHSENDQISALNNALDDLEKSHSDNFQSLLKMLDSIEIGSQKNYFVTINQSEIEKLSKELKNYALRKEQILEDFKIKSNEVQGKIEDISHIMRQLTMKCGILDTFLEEISK